MRAHTFFSNVSLWLVGSLGALGLGACVSDNATQRSGSSQTAASRTIPTCAGGLAPSLVAKLEALYPKNDTGMPDPSVTEQAKGIISSDPTLSGMSSSERSQIADKFATCINVNP